MIPLALIARRILPALYLLMQRTSGSKPAGDADAERRLVSVLNADNSNAGDSSDSPENSGRGTEDRNRETRTDPRNVGADNAAGKKNASPEDAAGRKPVGAQPVKDDEIARGDTPGTEAGPGADTSG
jgi:hypothetical protein